MDSRTGISCRSGSSSSPVTASPACTSLRQAMGLPGYVEQQAELEKVEEEEAAGELIEGQPALHRLRWLWRKQQARVSRALRLENMMGGMLLPQASPEIKLMADLLDRELKVWMKNGEMKTIPQAPSLEGTGLPITTPTEAFRVVIAYRRLQQELTKVVTLETEGHAQPDLHPKGDNAGGDSGS